MSSHDGIYGRSFAASLSPVHKVVAKPPPFPTASANQKSHLLPMRRFLLAEADRDLREILMAALDADNAIVVAVGNGREAFEQLLGNDGDFDVAVLDVRMPEMTGMDVLREAARAGCGVPIVLTIGFEDSDLRRRAQDLGAATVLEKPLEPERLREIVWALAVTGERPDASAVASGALSE